MEYTIVKLSLTQNNQYVYITTLYKYKIYIYIVHYQHIHF
jgi:hypothetical protein